MYCLCHQGRAIKSSPEKMNQKGMMYSPEKRFPLVHLIKNCTSTEIVNLHGYSQSNQSTCKHSD